jgi:FKBP-type peptidyl-prolyl cis-trans isomerase
LVSVIPVLEAAFVNRALILSLVLGLAACGGGDSPTTASATIVTEDIVVGTGPVAAVGDTALVHYVGRLTDGSEFDNSYTRGEPYSFVIGAGAVIAGFEQGVVGMRVGGTRRVTIPPSLAYGNQQVGDIPPNSTLTFDIELVELVGKS